MNSSTERSNSLQLEPLPYHVGVRDHLQREEPAVWNWFREHPAPASLDDETRFELLKSTYRLERKNHAELYQHAEELAARFSAVPEITLYQTQTPGGMNASLWSARQEAHIVLQGPVLEELSAEELRGLLAHELAHWNFCQLNDGEFQTTQQILHTLAHDRTALAAHQSTARRFQLCTELYCDRAALEMSGDLDSLVTMLVKVALGAKSASSSSFLTQAAEVVAGLQEGTRQSTHPEPYLRAMAASVWFERNSRPKEDPHEKIHQLIRGPLRFEELDILEQKVVSEFTRKLIDQFVAPESLRSPAILTHARMFFHDYQFPVELPPLESLQPLVASGDSQLREYLTYVLLDFVTADRDLEEVPLAQALTLAEPLGLKDTLFATARKELKLRKKQLELIDQTKEDLLKRASAPPRS